MNARARLALGLCMGLSLALTLTATSAQELPTGAARVVKKVQIMALTGKNEVLFHVAQIQENIAESTPGR